MLSILSFQLDPLGPHTVAMPKGAQPLGVANRQDLGSGRVCPVRREPSLRRGPLVCATADRPGSSGESDDFIGSVPLPSGNFIHIFHRLA